MVWGWGEGSSSGPRAGVRAPKRTKGSVLGASPPPHPASTELRSMAFISGNSPVAPLPPHARTHAIPFGEH